MEAGRVIAVFLLADAAPLHREAAPHRRPRTKVTVRRATIHLPADDFGTETVRGIGFRAFCDCGWKSRVTQTWAIARTESRAHSAWHAAGERVSIAGPV